MLEVILSPNPVLTQKCEPCDFKDKSLDTLSKEMINTMYSCCGIGLAGPQVGQLKRIIVIDCQYDPEDIENTKNPIVLLNPQIVDRSDETEESMEGCLSCPGISAPVVRHRWVKVKYYSLDGKENYIEGDGILSHCLQHEIDHLDGKTLFQSSIPEVRIQLLKDYEEALASGAKPGDVSSKQLQEDYSKK